MFNRLSYSALTRLIFPFVLSCAMPICVSSQTGDAQLDVANNTDKSVPPPTPERFNPGGPAEEDDPACIAEIPVSYFRRAKRLSAAYNGFAIELMATDRPLLQDNPLFLKYGNIQYDRRPDGKYAYLIMVPFGSRKPVEVFWQIVIKHRAPESTVVEYVDGQRSF